MIAAYPYLARTVVEHHISKGADAPLDLNLNMPGITQEDIVWHVTKGCFVTIKTADNNLRGCMGTILPTQENLGKEIIYNALTAATKDPRFSPISAEELPHLVYSVDVLSTPEPVYSRDDLDPARWGVIITKDNKRGLLLPALEGVTSIDQQLSIAAQKAGITSLEDIEVQRFSVDRHAESTL